MDGAKNDDGTACGAQSAGEGSNNDVADDVDDDVTGAPVYVPRGPAAVTWPQPMLNNNNNNKRGQFQTRHNVASHYRGACSLGDKVLVSKSI